MLYTELAVINNIRFQYLKEITANAEHIKLPILCVCVYYSWLLFEKTSYYNIIICWRYVKGRAIHLQLC